MIVILEGPDGSGKTTLARELVATQGFVYHHEGPPPRDRSVLTYYGDVLERWRGKHVVIDRLALGERVYGPVYRGADELGHAGWRVLTRLLSAVGAVQVLCLPPLATVLANWRDEQKEELYRTGGVAPLVRTYELYHGFQPIQDFVYDYTQLEPEPLWEPTDLSWLAPPTLPSPLVGSPTARYLLVGDVGSDPTAPFDLAFFATGGSSGYLTDALDAAGFTEDELAFINAYRHDGTATWLTAAAAALPLAVIVALGERAAAACAVQQLQCRHVPHPQFWKRFHYRDLAGYAELLRRCR